MSWINAKEQMPKEHNRIVMVYYMDSYHIAKYDKYQKGFLLQNGNVIKSEQENFHWAELTPPK